MRSLPSLIALLLAGLVSVATAATAPLRDITVRVEGQSAIVTFLVGGKVATVVTERKGEQGVQIRMRSLSADSRALRSAMIRPGVRTVRAHIERRDVLVTNIDFTYRVKSIAVTERTSEKIVVRVTLGASSSSPTSPPAAENRRSSRWKLETIVIDAGHGGRDPGATGIGGVVEKDVTLAVALALEREIKRGMPGVRVVMTRRSDEFVELYRRGQIANRNDGRLFISIHCNSMPEKPHPARGFECYILRPGRSEEAARVAEVENGAIRYEADRSHYSGDAEAAIMAAMAQSSFVRYSEEAAARLRSALRGTTGIPDKGLHQAGFLVLVGASMPAVLVELGFLSNAQDAKILASSSGQKKLAKGLYKGIREFERFYARSIAR